MEISIKWLGHSSFIIKMGVKIIYIDPYAGSYEEKANIILCSHNHDDHCDLSKIDLIKNKETTLIAPASCISKLNGTFKTIKPRQNISVEEIKIGAIPAYNYKRFKSPGHPWHVKGEGVGFLITADGKTIFHAGDTDFIPEMKEIKNVYLALLPSGGTYTMDNEDAVEAALAINPEIVIPMHRWDTDPIEFKRLLEEKSQKIKVLLLKPGDELKLN